jgi:hypothetical protein
MLMVIYDDNDVKDDSDDDDGYVKDDDGDDSCEVN